MRSHSASSGARPRPLLRLPALPLIYLALVAACSLAPAASASPVAADPTTARAAAALSPAPSDTSDATMETFARAEDCRFGRNGLAEDAVMALDLYHRAANGTGEGAGAALFALAEVYREGGQGAHGALGEGAPLAVKRDLRRAAALYNESAAAGNAAGQFAMGVLFSSGLFGVAPDQDKVRFLASPHSICVYVEAS